MADPRRPAPGRHDGASPDIGSRSRISKEAVVIGAVILIPLLGWLAYEGVSVVVGSADQTAAADPPPKDLCDLIGGQRLGQLVSNAKSTPQHLDMGEADKTYTRNCLAESDQSVLDGVYDVLQVDLSRSASLIPDSADEMAKSTFNSTCQDVAKRKPGAEAEEVPIAGLEQVGERSCGKASYSSASDSALVEIVVLRGRDVLHVRYNPDKADDSTPQRETIQLARDILAKL